MIFDSNQDLNWRFNQILFYILDYSRAGTGSGIFISHFQHYTNDVNDTFISFVRWSYSFTIQSGDGEDRPTNKLSYPVKRILFGLFYIARAKLLVSLIY